MDLDGTSITEEANYERRRNLVFGPGQSGEQSVVAWLRRKNIFAMRDSNWHTVSSADVFEHISSGGSWFSIVSNAFLLRSNIDHAIDKCSRPV